MLTFHLRTWVFNFFFSACIGPLSWAYPAEIFSTRTRAKSTAITSSSSWISNLFVDISDFPFSTIESLIMAISFIAQVTPRAFAAIGWKYANFSFSICLFQLTFHFSFAGIVRCPVILSLLSVGWSVRLHKPRSRVCYLRPHEVSLL